MSQVLQSIGEEFVEYSVVGLSNALKRIVEDSFDYVKVRGEASSVKYHSSGHVYFSLKDEYAVIDAICWKSFVDKNPSIKIQDGMEVICYAKVSTYPQRSKYQLLVEEFTPSGEGALLKLFEDLKKRLAEEGLFDESLKKPLPFLPKNIGIITSTSCAVIHDIITRLQERVGANVVLWPTLVQGEDAEYQIANAIEKFNSFDFSAIGIEPVDLIIVARGGGSIEDLWVFNSEKIARSVFNSKIPIISAIGHETDTTLIDYVSDLRAPTPTAAAEIILPKADDLAAYLDHLESRLDLSIKAIYSRNNNVVLSAAKVINRINMWFNMQENHFKLLVKDFYNQINQITQLTWRVDKIGEDLNKSINSYYEKQAVVFNYYDALLESNAYTRILEKGFVFLTDNNGRNIKSVESIKRPVTVQIHFQDGERSGVVYPLGSSVKRSSVAIYQQGRLWE